MMLLSLFAMMPCLPIMCRRHTSSGKGIIGEASIICPKRANIIQKRVICLKDKSLFLLEQGTGVEPA